MVVIALGVLLGQDLARWTVRDRLAVIQVESAKLRKSVLMAGSVAGSSDSALGFLT